MSQVVYNEGRVVGLSAWEIFRKYAEQYMDASVIPDEQQWLTSMIGSGASMILKVPANTPEGINDFDLPSESNLAAAGVIIANPFLGECAFDSSGWATKVTSYSPLGVDNADSYPPTSGGKIPSASYDPARYSTMLSDFTKITDGIVFLKNAIWHDIVTNTTNTFTGNGTITTFTLSELAHEIVSVEINGSSISSGYSLSSDKSKITFDIAPEADAAISVEFYPYAPYKDINPNFNNSSTIVRLYLNETINSDVYILLTGFNNKRILQGLSGFATGDKGGSADTNKNHWSDGGMLGPQLIPWASKIVFSVPNSAYMLANSLTRTIPSDEALEEGAYEIEDEYGKIKFHNLKNEAIKVSSLIDFNSIDITDYYDIHTGRFTGTPTLEENIEGLSLGTNTSYNTIVAWYPGMTANQILAEVDTSPQSTSNFFPPAIYAAKVTEVTETGGYQGLVPLDVAAPGTVKGFSELSDALAYKTLMPDNYSMYFNPDTKMYCFVVPDEDDYTKWASTAKLTYLNSDYPKSELVVGSTTSQIISLTNASGVPYGNNGVLDGSGGTVASTGPRTLIWDDILKSLKANQQVNILGTKLTAFANELNTYNTIGIRPNNNVTNVGAATFTLTGANSVSMTTSVSGSTNVVTLDTGSSIKSGTDFIEFNNGLRLYISTTEPDPQDIRVGSIGIGW